MSGLNPTLVNSIRSVIEYARTHVYRMANTVLLESYWKIGRLIVEDEQDGAHRAGYGKSTLKNLAKQLTEDYGKGFDESNLRNMRSFFLAFPKCDALRHELSWTHYRLLSRIENENKRSYYLDNSIHCGWNSRVLQRQINNMSYERCVSYPIPESPILPEHLIKDPYIFDFLGVPPDTKTSESDLESAIIDQIREFLLEMGKGFAFVGRQVRIASDTSDFFIDLVFYNYILKCFVIIDLKMGCLTHQDIGQMDMYVRMYDDLKRGPGDNPTMGILLCAEKDETIVKYSVLAESKQIFASQYLLYLPQVAELQRIIDQGRERHARRTSAGGS
ncbi:MAG: PDDEXK nuclease domain-containing protein [Bacteroidia bacterium]